MKKLIKKLKKEEKGQEAIIDEFLSSMNEEIDKFYDFYYEMERYLIQHMAKVRQTDTDNLSTNTFFEQLRGISKISSYLLETCTYININVTGIRKILKKLDKSLKIKDNPVAIDFIRQKIEETDSNLLYILEFKKIDEISAVLEDKREKLENYYQNNKNTFRQPSSSREEYLLMSEDNRYNAEKEIVASLNSTYTTLEKVDGVTDMIRTSVTVWNLFVSSKFIGIDSKTKAYKSAFAMRQEKRKKNLINKMAPQASKAKKLSLQQNVNIFFCLVHTFIFSLNTYVVQPSNALYVGSMGVSPSLSGLLLALAPMGAIFSTPLFSWMTNFSYRLPMIVSVLGFIAGNFLYSYADNLQSVYLMGMGRFLIGFSGGRVINRRYLIDNAPNSSLTYFSLIYVVISSVGMASGPLIGLGMFYFEEFEYYNLRFNKLTNPGWLCLALWTVFLVLVVLLFGSTVKDRKDKIGSASNRTFRRSLGRKPSLSDRVSDIEEGVNLNREVNQLLEDNSGLFGKVTMSFILLMLVVLFSKMVGETLIVMVPITVPANYKLTIGFVALLISTTSLLILPISLLVQHYGKLTQERVLLMAFMCSTLVGTILIIEFPVSTLYRFIIFYTVIFVSSNIVESIAGALIALFIPSVLRKGVFNAGFLIVISASGGKFIGSAMVSVFGLFGVTHIQNCACGFYGVCLAVLTYLVYKKYPELRKKAINRVIERKLTYSS